jgi:hypothetical protein
VANEKGEERWRATSWLPEEQVRGERFASIANEKPRNAAAAVENNIPDAEG